MSSFQEFVHLQIPLAEIKSATDNFADENLIGRGSFGNVYKGQLSRAGELINIAVKRLDRGYGYGYGYGYEYGYRQGDKEFWTEVSTLSRLKHENLVSLVGYCDEDGEKIIVNKHEINGSLDRYLCDPALTWLQRLYICVGAARALSYIHYDTRRSYDVMHRNIKSSKVLLNENWEAKICSFGLSVKNLATRRHRLVIDDAVGTYGYIDPVYMETGSVTHKSDVYSFGIMLFEVLCGRQAFIRDKNTNQYLVATAKKHYEERKVDEIIHHNIRNQMHPQSFTIFTDTAYHCLKEQRTQRPNMEKVARILEKAWELQWQHENPEHSKTLVESASISSSNYLKENNLEHLQNFSEIYCIGSGGYGKVYKAKLDHFDRESTLEIEGKNKGEFSKTRSTVAIKRIFNRANKQGEQSFISEIDLLTRCKHPNVVSLLGFCDEGPERILIYEYVPNGSLDDYLGNTDNMTIFSWVERIKMCLDIANGLNYLHSTTEEKQMIIHRDIKSANVLLGKNWEAKIADFGLSRIQHANQQGSTLNTNTIAGTEVYLDPEYVKTSKLKKESDIYSFGVVLFEIVCGRLAYDESYNVGNDMGLPSTVRRFFNEGILKEIVDSRLKEETHDFNGYTLNRGTNQESLDTFLKIAYQCLAETRDKRPTIKVIIKELEKALYFQENSKDNLKISLEDIKLATQNLSDYTVIGIGASGKVYKGELTHAFGCSVVAAKRLNSRSSQREPEFLAELEILLEYKHENVIGLIGYCDEMDEKIIVYEYAYHKSLDLHLSSDHLTWMKRLEICIDVANGLEFLQGGVVTQDVVIHRDIKSANILLTKDWKAKIANFWLSLISPIDQDMDYVIDNAKGTIGYCDPLYAELGFLSKESDIYSFGVVLFEILCGRLVIENDDQLGNLTVLVRQHLEEGTLEDIVLKSIKDQIVPESLSTFARVADQCLHPDREKRPTASEIVIQLKKSLEFQEDHEIWEPKLPKDYKEIIQMSNYPENFSARSKKDIYNMLYNGILLQEGKLWFSLGTNGEINEMVSSKFSYKNRRSHTWRSIPESRFRKVAEMVDISKLKAQIKIRTQFLSPGLNYGVYLVFKFCAPRKVSNTPMFVNLKYKMGNEILHSYFATSRDNEWMMIELFRFLNHEKKVDFEVLLESFSRYYCKSDAIYVEGFEFRAIDNVKKSKKPMEVQQVSKSNSKRDKVRSWVRKMNVNKEDMLREVNTKKDHLRSRVSRMKYHLHSAKELFNGSTKEVNLKLSAQFRFEGNYEDSNRSNNYQECEKLSLLGKVKGIKHHMIMAKRALHDSCIANPFDSKSSTEFRFQEKIELLSQQVLRIKCEIDSRMLSSITEYAGYLVFMLSEECSGLHCPVIIRDLLRRRNKGFGFLYFRSPRPWNLYDDTQIPKKREDGWMEVIVWKNNFSYELRKDYILLNLKLIIYEGTLSGLITRGLEFRPL